MSAVPFELFRILALPVTVSVPLVVALSAVPPVTLTVMSAMAVVPIADPAGVGPAMWIVPVPEPKTVKNRVHIDVVGDTQALLAVGARLLRARDAGPDDDPEQGGIEWDVLADPEGNEFCCSAPG